MERQDSDNEATRRWTCEACGCNTNLQSDRACSICGTSSGPSLLRRAGYATRSGGFARGFAARRGMINEDIDDYLWDRVVDGVEMGSGDNDVISTLAMEVAGSGGRSRDTDRQSILDAARTFSLSSRESSPPDPEELLRSARENAALYQPKWASISHLLGRVNSGNGIEVGDGERQNVAHLPLGAGEGRAVRALEAVPKSVPLNSFISPSSRNQELRRRRAFGFRVAFDHSRREVGSSLGGCYLIGVTTSAFAAFGERNGLQQSPFFWGIEDGGSKYEGSSRYSHSSRGSRRGPFSYAIELGQDEASSDDVLFGCREVVTVVVDCESRTLTFWRDSQLLGTLVSNLPRSGNIFPVAVPFNAGVTVAISGMDDDPLQLLRTFASGWKQAQQQKEEERRRILAAQRSVLIRNGQPTPELVHVLSTLFSWYAHELSGEVAPGSDIRLNHVDAARLWYRCGMKLSYIDTVYAKSSGVTFDDFLGVVQKVISEDDNLMRSDMQMNGPSDSFCEVGDNVELVEGYERYGDASNGPLQPGDRGIVLELQQGSNGERHSVRVLYNGRRWWYQPQALLSEKSRLIESPSVWFLRSILRSHGFDHTTLQPLWGKPVTATSWQVGDIVVPRRVPFLVDGDIPSSPMDSYVGRVVSETTNSSSSATVKGRESGSVLVEFIDEGFREAAGVASGGSIRASDSSLETCRIRVNKLLHSSVFHGSSVLRHSTTKLMAPNSLSEGSKKFQHTTTCEDPFDLPAAPDNCFQHQSPSAASVSEKVRAYIEAVARLDIAAIEAVTKDCKKNAASLASIFSAGLPDAVVAAIDCAEGKLKNSNAEDSLSQPIAALGALSVSVVEQIFGADTVRNAEAEDETTDSEHHPYQQYSASADESMGEAMQFSAREQQQTTDRTSNRPRDRGPAQDANLNNRISSLQQRRNVLLALMSRARRSNATSFGDFVERENSRYPGDISFGQVSSNGQSLRTAAGRSFPFGQQSELLLDGSWDEMEGFSGRGSPRFAENSNDVFVDNRSATRAVSSPIATRTRTVSNPFLESILRGQRECVIASQSQGEKGLGQFSCMRSLVQNGLLGNSLRWMNAVVDAKNRKVSPKSSQGSSAIFKNVIDEDGMPVLRLAISLGCSGEVIEYLIQTGSRVTAEELRKAAWTNQPQVLSILLQNAVYFDGMIDLNRCSREVVAVVCNARARQEELSRKMRKEAGAFVVLLLRKLLQLGLKSRWFCPSQSGECSRAVSWVLVGNVLLHAMQRTQQIETASNSERCQRDPSDRGFTSDDNQRPSELLQSPKGLVGAIPSEILGQCFVSSTSHITQYLLLVEDFLCSKEVGDGAIGLTLLSTLLKKLSFISSSSEMERYGITELVSSHDVIASGRLAEILSRQLPGRLDASTNVLGVPLEQSSNVDPSKLSLTGVVLCPKKHTARLHITRHSSFRCDLCGNGVERGRPMHGCRECDWDACEKCTDKAEGGFVKCSYVKELALECKKLLSPDHFPDESLEDWEDGILEKLQSLNNSSHLNRLSIRLLQRDIAAIQELATMIKVPGQITVHQFTSIILPSLHASLLGRSSEIGGFGNVLHLGAGHRSKKPRVVGGSFRDSDFPTEGHLHGRIAFCRDAVKCLLSVRRENGLQLDHCKEFNDSIEGSRDSSGVLRSHGQVTDSQRNDEVDENIENKGKRLQGLPEVLRRLHQVLSLYETVTLVSKSSLSIKQSNSGTPAGSLQALTQPVEINLSPSAFEPQPNICRSPAVTTLHAEPLISIADLELHVLRICRMSHPSFVSFCRRLAADKAVIIERSAVRGKNLDGKGRSWRLAQVLSFDEVSGSHTVRYAVCLKRNSVFTHNIIEVRRDCAGGLGAVEYEEKETRLILAVREYCILHRNCAQGERVVSKSAFNMARLLSDGIVPAAEESSKLDTMGLSVGSRVESNFASDNSWRVYTVIASHLDSAGGNGIRSFTLVSDSGEVCCGVPFNQVRRVDRDNIEGHVYREERRNFFEGQMNQVVRRNLALDRGNRTFPFLTNRQQLSFRRDSQERSSGVNRLGTLKRTWSALSLVESMCPIELSSPDDQDTPRGLIADGFVWHCSLDDCDFHVVAEHNAVEAPPQMRVEFSAHETLPTVDVSSNRNMTLIGALNHLYGRDETLHDHNFWNGSVHKLFYSIVAGIEIQTEKDGLCSGLFPSARETIPTFKHGFEDEGCRTPRRNLMKPISTNQPPGSILRLGKDESCSWLLQENRSRKLSRGPCISDEENSYRGLCEGLGEICVQCIEVIGLLSEYSEVSKISADKVQLDLRFFENAKLSNKLMEQLEDPLTVVGRALPEWCEIAPMFAPRVFSYESRRLLLERAAFGVSRSALRQQEAKVNVGRLRQRMADLRARAVELVGEAFSGGAEDPTALQLQADELYGMEEALATRVKAAFRAERWEEHALQVAKTAVRREKLLTDAAAAMNKYANDENVCRRRLEVRFENESGFDAASGDEAGVTRGFYADVAEALLNCENVAGVCCSRICPVSSSASLRSAGPVFSKASSLEFEQSKLPLWIPDMDSSGQVVIPTPRADPRSGLGVYPRPLPTNHPQMEEVLVRFRLIGRLFAAALRDGFMFPLPLSSSFLKFVQRLGNGIKKFGCWTSSSTRNSLSSSRNNSNSEDASAMVTRETILTSFDLPRPGFLGGEVYGVEEYICRALDRLDDVDPPLSRYELEKRYRDIATNKNFAREALGKSYDCSFEDYFQDRTFVDPLDTTQGEDAAPLCLNGYKKSVTIYNIREWVALAKQFILHDGVMAQTLAFRCGVADFFSVDYLRLFTPEEVQRDVCGVGDKVDTWEESDVRKLFKLDGGKGAAEALVAVAAIGGEGGAALSRRFGPSSPTINFLVKALLEAAPKERRQFLSFVTSVPIVTPGRIEVVPIVSPSGEFLPMRDPGCLPRANTCARRLYLPQFETYDSFSLVLWAVVREESKFKGFFEWRGS